MSGTGLRWEAERRDDGRVWRWLAYSGNLFVGDAWMSNLPDRPGRWRWQCPLFCGGCDLDAEKGEGDTPEAVRAAAEAAWGEWCVSAGLDPAGEVQRLRDALLDALAVFDIGEGTRFREHYRDVIERAQAAVGREAVRDAAAPGAVP